MRGIGSRGWSYLLSFSVLLVFGVLADGCRRLPRRLTVCEVQGAGMASPYLDQEVIVIGLVIVDLERVEPGGLVILDETCPVNGESSRGLYVSYSGGDDLVDVGDEIQVQGFIREIGGETRLEASRSGLEVLGVDNPLPDPIDLMDYIIPPLAFGYERWEGQLVAIPGADPLEREDDPDRLYVLPRIALDPSEQLICFQQQSYALEIKADLLWGGLGDFLPAGGFDGLVGLIRQQQDGYQLQLIEEPVVKIRDNIPLAEEIIPTSPAGNLENTPQMTTTPTISPTKTPEPSPKPTLTAKPTIIPSPTYYPVRLLLSEVLPDPAGEEPGGEWIEIYNPDGAGLPLDGIKIGDEISPEGKEGLLRFPNGFFIQGGQVMVIANQAREYESVYGFLPDFELVDSDSRVPDLKPYDRWGRNLVKLSNTGDEVLILDPWDQVVDLVVYGTAGSGGFSPPVAAPQESHSLERYPPDADSDQAGDWREQSFPCPGRLDRSPPTETASQTAVPAPSLTSSPTPDAIAPTQTPESITPSASSTNLPLATETLTDTPLSTATPAPAPISTETPEMSFTPTPFPEISPTVTNSETSTLTPVVTPSPTITAPPSHTPGEEMTPTNTPGPRILINEILADPDPILGDSNGDGEVNSDDDEFVELVNLTGKTLDISGWSIFDEVRLRYAFPDGTSLPNGCAVVVFGGGVPSGTFGGSQVFTAGSLGLNNTGDLITVVDPDGVIMAVAGYGSEGNQNQSLTRNPDLTGSLPLVPHSDVPGSGGRLFSPGTRVDLTVFGDCP